LGHTDSDGEDAKNLELSKKRSESVKIALNKDFGISLDRMQTDGKVKQCLLVIIPLLKEKQIIEE
jgi:outer membrane protein OmpA-like peptidoglycan-associated protein